jgi:hypothetical protein
MLCRAVQGKAIQGWGRGNSSPFALENAVPRMPTKENLSGPMSLRSGRAVISAGQVDASAIGRGLEAAGRGVGQIANAMSAIDDKAKREQDAIDLARAEAAQRASLFETERVFDEDGDYATQDKRYTPLAVEATDRAANLIRDPQKREMWRLKAENDIIAGRERLLKRADTMGRQERFVQLQTILEKKRSDFTDPRNTREDQSRIFREARDAIELGKRSGMLDPANAHKLEKEYVHGAVKHDAERQLNDSPEALRQRLLGERAPQGELEIGNIDLSARGAAKNADGSISTIKSISINENGREVLIPTIDPEGREMTEEEAIERYLGTGEHLGRFDSAANATAYAKRLSERMGKKFMPHRGASPEAISIRLETGKTDPLEGVKNISKDSAQSRSYGNFGLNSQPGAGAHQFAAEYGSALGLSGTPGTAEFDRSWRAVAAADPEGLHAAEMEWYGKNVLLPTQGELSAAGLPPELAEDGRVVAYFADRKIQQGPVSISNHAERVRAAFEKSGGKVEPFLRAMTEADRGNLESDFRTALRTGVYSQRGNDNRVYNRLNMALAMGGEDNEPSLPGDDPYSVLSPLERSDFIAKAERAARTKFEGNRENLKQQLDDDVESIRRTGQGGEPDLEMARRVLEPNQINRYFLNRAEAEMEHRAVSDLPTLPNGQITQRLNEIAPKPGEDFYEAKAKIYDKAKKMADDLREWRDVDPARSVDMLPEVKQAAEAASANPGDPAAIQELARARIDAQAKVGVPETRRSPITKAEAKVMMAPIRGLEGKSLADAMQGVIASLEEQYGPYAHAAGVSAVEAVVQNRDIAESLAAQMKRAYDGLSPSATLSRRIDWMNETAAADRAFKQFGNRLGDEIPTAPAQGDPFSYYGLPKPSQIAINALKGNPGLAGDFERKFGPGSAAQVLAEPE